MHVHLSLSRLRTVHLAVSGRWHTWIIYISRVMHRSLKGRAGMMDTGSILVILEIVAFAWHSDAARLLVREFFARFGHANTSCFCVVLHLPVLFAGYVVFYLLVF